jgi:hypothetical protein
MLADDELANFVVVGGFPMFRLIGAVLLALLIVGTADACRRHRRGHSHCGPPPQCIIVMPCQPRMGPPPIFEGPIPTPLPPPGWDKEKGKGPDWQPKDKGKGDSKDKDE